MKTETIILASAILLTGLMAGIFFTWSNAIKPGIGKLNDLEYLRALQSMNRVILNKAFMGIFLGSIIAVALVPVFHFKLFPNSIFWMFVLALVTYWIGVFGTTAFGNIPLNEILDKVNLEPLNLEEITALRTRIEVKRNNLNLIRSISSGITFALLIISYLFLNR
jgi:uncharacterized membrane protein